MFRSAEKLADPGNAQTQKRGRPRLRSARRQEFAGIGPVIPAGSPYGFTEAERQEVRRRKLDRDVLYVVLSYQFKSKRYDPNKLKKNLKSMFDEAVRRYNEGRGSEPVTLNFRALRAGLGEHLFNSIARDIIGADIAVFETSDRNTNVYLEMGVALTWGISVLPLKKVRCKKPSSDISGQPWVDYVDSGARLHNPEHLSDIVEMIARVVREKRDRIDDFSFELSRSVRRVPSVVSRRA